MSLRYIYKAHRLSHIIHPDTLHTIGMRWTRTHGRWAWCPLIRLHGERRLAVYHSAWRVLSMYRLLHIGCRDCLCYHRHWIRNHLWWRQGHPRRTITRYWRSEQRRGRKACTSPVARMGRYRALAIEIRRWAVCELGWTSRASMNSAPP